MKKLKVYTALNADELKVEVDNFNEDRWNECAEGIHFFINRQEAINY